MSIPHEPRFALAFACVVGVAPVAIPFAESSDDFESDSLARRTISSLAGVSITIR